MALGGRWGRLEEEAETEAAGDNAAESDATAGEALESEVVEPSEVRTENDPWNE